MDAVVDNDAVFRAYGQWRGAPLAIATVISTWGSAPRPKGSHMLVHADGRMEGSISGGCVEADILQLAADVIASGVSELRSYGVSGDTAWDAGLPCGGTIKVLVQPVSDTGSRPDLFSMIEQARASGQALLVHTDLSSGQSGVGIGQREREGDFVNRYLPPRRLLIVGAVQIAQALCGIAIQLGIDTVVIDPRTRFLTAERCPGMTLCDEWPDQAVAALKPDQRTAVVTLSHARKSMIRP